MANTLRIKRRSSVGAAGSPTSLENAELAFNEADNILYYGTGTGGAGGSATSVIAIGGYGAYTTLGTTQTITGNKTFSGTVIVPDASFANAKLANMATKTYKGRTSALTGVSEDVAVATLKTDLVLVKGDVGLGLVDNTSDASKPVSTAQQTALNLKANLASPTFTGTVTVPTPTNATDAVTKSYVDSSLPTLSGTSNQIAYSAGVISLAANVITPGDLTVTGDLTVQGNTTTLNTATLIVEDKNIVLANVASPNDTTADGAGISVLGATTKTLNWVSATNAWTSSEHFNILAGKSFYIGGSAVLSNTTLASSVVASSLTSLGTIGTGVWQGTAVGLLYGGTGSTTAGGARTALGLAIGTDVQAFSSQLAALAANTATIDGGTF